MNPYVIVNIPWRNDFFNHNISYLKSSDASSDIAGWGLANPKFGSSVNLSQTGEGGRERLCPSRYC